MALFTDIILNKDTGRHELLFVNQQYDFLMWICYNEATQQYELGCPEAEAREIFKFWGGREFDWTIGWITPQPNFQKKTRRNENNNCWLFRGGMFLNKF